MKECRTKETPKMNEYKKTQGAATTKGQEYEYGLVALVYLRIIDWTENFRLGSNLEGLGQFDDVFLTLDWKDDEGLQKSQVYCIQLKHKEKGRPVTTAQLLKDKGDFSLPMYYRSYCKIEDAINTKAQADNSHIMRDNNFGDYNFSLFTNCTVVHNSHNISKKQLSRVERILDTGDEQQAIFSFGPEDTEIWRLRDDCGDSDRYHAFLSRLRIFSGQRGVDTLTILVEKEVSSCAQVDGNVSKYLSSVFLGNIKHWWNNNTTFLTELSLEWNEALITDLNANSVDNLKKINYELTKESFINVDNKMETDAYLNLVVPGVDSDIRCLKIWAELEHKHGISMSTRYLVMDACDVLRRKKQVSSMCKKGICDLLVINTNDSTEIQHLIGYIGVRKMVLVSAKKILSLDKKCAYYEDVWMLDHLTEGSQIRIHESIVNFQGEDVSLAELCDRDVLSQGLDSKTLGTLIKGGKVSVGSTLAGVDEFYISRTLRHQSVLQEQVLLVKHSLDVFAVSGLPQGRRVVSSSSTVILSIAEADTINRSFVGSEHSDKVGYLELCKKFKSQKSVHWVIYEGKFLTWRQSHGSEETPCRYIDRMSSSCVGETSCYHGEGLLDDWRERLVLVTGEPGMGKSTLLLHLAAEIKKQNPASWVVHVALSNVETTFKNMKPQDITEKQVFQFLLDAAHITKATYTKLSQKLLIDSIQRKGDITVLLDAVDEVSPLYEKQVQMIVELLLHTPLPRLWISSRTVLQEFLQRNLRSIPLVLQPFTRKEQIIFLTHYLTNQEISPFVDTDVINKQALELLELMNTNRISQKRHICDVPLHARMILDSVTQLLPEFVCSNSDIKALNFLNLCGLYEKFLERKIENAYNKYGLNTAKAAVLENIERDQVHFMDNLMKCSLIVLFSPKQYRTFNIPDLRETVQQFLRDIIKERTGIIEGVVDGKPKFVHFTLCEYLAAKWFKQMYEGQSNNGEYQNQNEGTNITWFKRIMKKVFKTIRGSDSYTRMLEIFDGLFEIQFEQVRLFFDHMLSDKCDLHQAVLTGNTQTVCEIIDAGSRVNQLDEGGRMALHLAAAYGNVVIVNLLLNVGSPAEEADKVLGWTPMRYADRAQSWRAAIELLAHGASATQMPKLKRQDIRRWGHVASKVRDNYEQGHIDANTLFMITKAGYTEVLRLVLKCNGYDSRKYHLWNDAVHVAVKNDQVKLLRMLLEHISHIRRVRKCVEDDVYLCVMGAHVEALRVLLEFGADVSSVTRYGYTALRAAAQRGHVEILKMLLEQGIDVSAADMEGDTMLYEAVQGDHVETVRVLLEHGVDVRSTSKDGYTALHLAAQQGHVEMLIILLEHGADVSSTGKYGYTALHQAAWGGHVEAVRVLLEHGADVSSTSKDGYTALHQAALGGHVKAVRILVEHGADVSSTGKDGYTALHLAAQQGHVEMLIILLEHGADVSSTGKYGYTVLHQAAWGGHVEAVRVLLEHGADVSSTSKDGYTALHQAALDGHVKAVRILLEHGADVSSTGKDGYTALHLAAQQGHVEMLIILLEHGADVSSTGKYGYTALHQAAWGGHVEAVRVLLEHGADVSSTSKDGYTALHQAALGGHVKAVRILLEHGADVSSTGKEGYTALHLAAQQGHVEMLIILLEHGADVSSTGKYGYTALHQAAWGGHVEAVLVRLEHGADVSSTSKDGYIALHQAALGVHVKAVRILLEHGADVSSTAKDGYTALHLAAQQGHVEMLIIVLEHGADVSSTGKDGYTALHHAALGGHVKAVRVLLEHGADVSSTGKDGQTALHQAALGGHVKAVRVLLEHEADVSSTGKDGYTALHSAALGGHVEAVRVLLEHGADVSSTGKDGHTALHQAALGGHMKAVRELLEHGADVSSTGKDGHTALHQAALGGHVKAVRMLLEHEADVSSTGKDGHTALHLAAQQGHVEMLIILLEHGADVRSADIDGDTALHSAVLGGHVEAVRVLLEHGADVSSTGNDGYTALHSAALGGHVEAVRVLLEHGADVSSTGNDGDTALHSAALGGHVEVVRVLLKHGADVSSTGNDGYTALHSAALGGHVEAVRVLLEHGADVSSTSKDGHTALHQAAWGGHVEAVRVLLEHGADVSSTSKDGYTALHPAALGGHVKAVRILLEHGADVSSTGMDGHTALHAAAWGGHVKAVRLLLEHGADVSSTSKDGHTALHQAALGGHVEAVRVLLEHGADVSSTSKDGYTALHPAALGGHVKAVRILLEHGADVSSTGKDGHTALHAAAWGGHVKAVRLLLEHGADVSSTSKDGHTALHQTALGGHVEAVRVLLDHRADVSAANYDGYTALHSAALGGHVEAVRVLLDHGADENTETRFGKSALNMVQPYSELWKLFREYAA